MTTYFGAPPPNDPLTQCNSFDNKSLPKRPNEKFKKIINLLYKLAFMFVCLWKCVMISQKTGYDRTPTVFLNTVWNVFLIKYVPKRKKNVAKKTTKMEGSGPFGAILGVRWFFGYFGPPLPLSNWKQNSAFYFAFLFRSFKKTRFKTRIKWPHSFEPCQKMGLSAYLSVCLVVRQGFYFVVAWRDFTSSMYALSCSLQRASVK